MTDTLLFHVVIQGDSSSVYNSSIWILSIWYNPDDNTIFSMDSFGDIDTIENASCISDAMTKASDFFRNDEIIRAA